jgi:Zn-dependent protease with chaperone function
MLVKPLSFLLIFLLTIVNFIILLMPILIIMAPLLVLSPAKVIDIFPHLIVFLAFCTTAIMIMYLLADMFFGFTAKRMHKGSTPFERAGAIQGHADIGRAFEHVKQRFGMKNVKLYIGGDMAVANAYAIGSMKEMSITITMGLLNRIHSKSKNHNQYIDAVRGILGHEMSHLVNQDFLPGLLIMANDRANALLSKFIRRLFMIIISFFRFFPFVGWLLAEFILIIYNMSCFLINFFFKYVLMPVYMFVQKKFSRSVEYRCDRDSALAFGGQRMAFALSTLGKGSYFTIFSTHPSTKSRMNKVKGIAPAHGVVKVSIVNSLANFFSLMLVVVVCAILANETDLPYMYDFFVYDVLYPIKNAVLAFFEYVREGRFVEIIKGQFY